nr:hypothetical protein GCM10025732_49010 [Glycomyces mayteni]
MLRALLSATRTARPDDPWDLAGKVAQLEAAHRAHFAQPDMLLVRRAYRIAEQMHRGQARRSGEPYITHPIAVSTILADLGVDTPTIAAGLLHDTVEDTPYSSKRSAATSATRSPSWSTASRSSTRSTSAPPPRPRRSASSCSPPDATSAS